MKKWFKNKLFCILAWFITHAVAASAQTLINVNANTKCPGSASTNPIVSLGVTGQVAGLPVVLFTCVQLDPLGFGLDKTTTPWTIRAISNSPASSSIHVEIPTGSINGSNPNFSLSATPAPGLPVLVYKNGLLLTACPIPIVSSCDGDYQLSGVTLLFLTSAQTTFGVATVPNISDKLQVVYWH